jgi:hypothetical protein
MLFIICIVRKDPLDIKAIKFGDALWEHVIDYSKNCSWGAGIFLANQMKEKFCDVFLRRSP